MAEKEKEKKTEGQKLSEKLLLTSKNMGEKDPDILQKSIEFCEGYKGFLANKTEREVVDYTVPLLKKAGYREFVAGTKYKAGAKVYINNRGKNLIMVTYGKKDPSQGLHISASHIDSPRLDFKPVPLDEADGMAYFRTHYYGGIKKYQWSVVPLSLHGVVSLKDGKDLKVCIGEKAGEPQFVVTDLLPHLAREQMKKPSNEVITGEQLNVLIGSWPFKDDKVAQKVKLNIAKIIFDKYGITEGDFLSAELCAVPAYAPVDVGLDRSMVGGYGQDDSSCAYAILMAEMDTKEPEYTTVTVFADKEETGSAGPTGLSSTFLVDNIALVVEPYGVDVRKVLAKSMCLSCDVNSAYDPMFPEVFERNNCSFINRGPALTKYTGGGGKYDTNDASAETMGLMRRIFDDAGVVWQIGELGKVDAGGGGTVAMYVSGHNVDTVDLGVPVLSMHAPFEQISKADEYMMYKAVLAFNACKQAKP
jgi:aspartyl aminopeptidase